MLFENFLDYTLVIRHEATGRLFHVPFDLEVPGAPSTLPNQRWRVLAWPVFNDDDRFFERVSPELAALVTSTQAPSASPSDTTSPAGSTCKPEQTTSSPDLNEPTEASLGSHVRPSVPPSGPRYAFFGDGVRRSAASAVSLAYLYMSLLNGLSIICVAW